MFVDVGGGEDAEFLRQKLTTLLDDQGLSTYEKVLRILSMHVLTMRCEGTIRDGRRCGKEAVFCYEHATPVCLLCTAPAEYCDDHVARES